MRWLLLLGLLLPAAAQAQRIDRRALTRRALTGVAVAAPHAGFDTDTDKMLRLVVADTGLGWVIAHDYRKLSAGRFINVNRPTEQPVTRGRRGSERRTERAAGVYAEYRKALLAAAGVRRAPLRLLVELHGQASRQVIELSSTGFSKQELATLKTRYAALAREAGIARPYPLHVWPLEPTYRYRGQSVRFKFTAGGARRAGSFQPSMTRRGLHFEFPGEARKDPALRERYAAVVRGLIQPLLR